eukprot:Em0015g1095a
MPSRNRKKRTKQRAEYLQKQEENKAKARERYKADPEKKKASVRESYKADPEKKKASVRESYKADPEKKKASVRESYKADPEKKKASRYGEDLEENRAAKRQRYGEDLEENRAVKRQRYQESVEENRAAKRRIYRGNSATIKAARMSRYWKGRRTTTTTTTTTQSYSLFEPNSRTLAEYGVSLEKAILRDTVSKISADALLAKAISVRRSQEGSLLKTIPKVNAKKLQESDILVGHRFHTAGAEPYFFDNSYTHRKQHGAIPVDLNGRCVVAEEIKDRDKVTMRPLKWKCTNECRKLTSEEVAIVLKTNSLFQKSIEDLRAGLDALDSGCGHVHYDVTLKSHSGFIDQLGHPIYCELPECSSPLRVIRAAMPHYPALRTFTRLLYKARKCHMTILAIDSALASGNIDELIPFMGMKDNLSDLFSEDGVEHAVVSEDHSSSGLGCIERDLKVTHADLIAELQSNLDKYETDTWQRLKAHVLQNGVTEQLYICQYCRPFLNKNTIPARCVLNGLVTELIPDELKSLNALSKQLIQRAKAFQTIVRLGTYSGKVPAYNALQACRGCMFFLPLPLNKTWDTLSEIELGGSGLVALPDPQLYIIVNGVPTKDKIVWQTLVDVNAVKLAIQKLKEINWLYKNVDDASLDEAAKNIVEVVDQASSIMLEKASTGPTATASRSAAAACSSAGPTGTASRSPATACSSAGPTATASRSPATACSSAGPSATASRSAATASSSAGPTACSVTPADAPPNAAPAFFTATRMALPRGGGGGEEEEEEAEEEEAAKLFILSKQLHLSLLILLLFYCCGIHMLCGHFTHSIALCNVLALAALGFFTSTFSPFLVNKLHISLPHVGLVFLAGPALYMLAALVAGPLSDKFGTRPFIICGLLVCGSGYFLVGPADFIASPRLWLTIVSFTAIGFGAALTFVPAYADLLNIAKSLDTGYNLESLTTVVSGIISSALSCGDMLGPFVGGVLTDYLDFQTSAVIFGEILLAQGLLVLLLTLVERRVST